MLAVALVILLVSLAAPSYRVFLARAHRLEAIAALLQVAACQEKQRAMHGAYDLALCLPDANAYYRYAYTGGTGSPHWSVQAHPVGRQRDDRCGVLTLDALGRRAADGTGADSAHCWMAG